MLQKVEVHRIYRNRGMKVIRFADHWYTVLLQVKYTTGIECGRKV
jgi:hypothetical protein